MRAIAATSAGNRRRKPSKRLRVGRADQFFEENRAGSASVAATRPAAQFGLTPRQVRSTA
jgi:hypothetical protein